MTNTFYRAFEDLHRGSRQTIKDRLRAYMPFVKPLLEAYPAAQAVDLGCGRGEWLELVSEIGYQAQGVDLDEGMLQACRQLGLDAQLGDAIVLLQKLPDQTQAVVSAFHVVEHIAFDQLQELVKQAMRVLIPGGLLIMETPNPENIIVATSNFYVDPSHQRPLPPLLLSFVAEHAGFLRVKTVRLQESKVLRTKTNVSLEEVFSGASPDYAIVAQKSAPSQVLELTAKAFESNYGLDLSGMLNRWDARCEQIELNAKQAINVAEQALATAQQSRVRAQEAKDQAQQADAVSKNAQLTTEMLHIHAQHIEIRLQEVMQSYSWRMTAPLRWLGVQSRRLREEGVINRLKALAKKTLRQLNFLIEKTPALRHWLLKFSHKTGLYHWLKKLSARLNEQNEVTTQFEAIHGVATDQTFLSPSSQKIYDALKIEIKHIQKGQH